MKKTSKTFLYIKKLFKSKLFIASLTFYIALPIAIIAIVNSDTDLRTAGLYDYYIGETLVTTIELTKSNKVKMVFYGDIEEIKYDNEYKYYSFVSNWSFRESDWYKEDKYKDFEFKSRQYILFENGDGGSYFIFFKIGNKLYSDYQLSETRGGGQKCYIKR